MAKGSRKKAIEQKVQLQTNYSEGFKLKLVFKILFAVLFFVLGFNFSKSTFFSQVPVRGYHIIIEMLLSGLSAVFGFYVVPEALKKARYWLEGTITTTVSNIVWNFWEQQTGKIQEARREKQRLKAEEIEKKSHTEMQNAVVLDTSVLIDGRILDIVKVGFFDRNCVVLSSVIDELQLISDSKNPQKRQRGRRGLDVVKELKKKIKIIQKDYKGKEKEVDAQLVSFAKENGLKLMTLDFNLNKVAGIKGVKVLNLNDLVNSLKTVMLPGEELKIKILQEGKEKEQGIGYLEDGTMVIVEDTKSLVGQEVSARVSKIIQSSAGKIIFCDLNTQPISVESQ